MTKEQACHAIMGDKLAHDIIQDMGLHWAIVAALADPNAANHPDAVAILTPHL